jgi:hypothetical protein
MSNTTTEPQRKVYTIAQRREAILKQISALNAPLSKEAITAIINSELQTKGAGQSTKTPPKTVNGITYYHCSRSNQFFKLENMVTTKDNESKGYSKASQDALTAYNRKTTELEDAVTALATAGDFEAIPKAGKALSNHQAKANDKYNDIKGDID